MSEILEEKNPEVVTEQERNAARLQEKNKAIANDQPLVRSYVISRTAKGSRPKKSNWGVVVNGYPDLLVHLAHCCYGHDVSMTTAAFSNTSQPITLSYMHY